MQLRRVWRSLDSSQWLQASIPLLHTVSTTVMCCWLGHWTLRLTSYSISWMWLISDTRKFDRGLLQHFHQLHCLDVPDWVNYKLVLMVHNLQRKAAQYLTDCCISISIVANQRHLHSASCHHLVVSQQSQHVWSSGIADAGPAAWNSLTDDLHDPMLSTDSLRRLLKTFVSTYSTLYAI